MSIHSQKAYWSW